LRTWASVRAFAWIELIALWAAWWYPFFFRAPRVQKRPSITVPGPTRVGLLLETGAILLVWIAHVPGAPRTTFVAMASALVLGLCGVIGMWTSITHLGRQFRIHAGLYEDHELVRTGPYALVRHPIYASLLAMMLATGILLARWEWLAAGVLIYIVGTEIRIHSEETLLASRFGEQFRDYQRRVRAYVPFLR
jgi:protein-S-isoprenylcysteine O-methyltransferase Ste14